MNEINNNSTEKIAIEPEEIGSTTEKIDENSEKITSETEKIAEIIPKKKKSKGERGPDKNKRRFNPNSLKNLIQYKNNIFEETKPIWKKPEFWVAIGITSYVLYDKKIRKQYRPLWRKEMFEIEKYVYDQIFRKHHHGSLLIDESINGKIFVILEIDYSEMSMIIKNRTEQENEKLVKDKLLELKLNP